MTAQQIYDTVISQFDHVLVGSRAITYHTLFRKAHDWDVKIKNPELLMQYLQDNQEKLEITIENLSNPEYAGNLMCRLLCGDGVYVDIIEGEQPYTVINDVKVATLESIVNFKEHLLEMELSKDEPRIEVVKKHFFDLKKLK
jgi:hypothetical protein